MRFLPLSLAPILLLASSASAHGDTSHHLDIVKRGNDCPCQATTSTRTTTTRRPTTTTHKTTTRPHTTAPCTTTKKPATMTTKKPATTATAAATPCKTVPIKKPTDLHKPHLIHFPHGHYDSYKHHWESSCKIKAELYGSINLGFTCSQISATTAIVTCITQGAGGIDIGLNIGTSGDLFVPHKVKFPHGHFHDYEKHWNEYCALSAGIFGHAHLGFSCAQVSANVAVVTCITKTEVGIDVGLSIGSKDELFVPVKVSFPHGQFESYRHKWQKSCALQAGIYGVASLGFNCLQVDAGLAIVTCVGQLSGGIDVGLTIGAEVDLHLPHLVTFERGHFHTARSQYQHACGIYVGAFGKVNSGFSCSQLTATTAVVICSSSASIGLDLGLSIGSKADVCKPHAVKFPFGNFEHFKLGWKAACAAYATKYNAKSAFSCRQTSSTTAIVTCGTQGSLLGHIIGDLTGGLVGHLKLPLA